MTGVELGKLRKLAGMSQTDLAGSTGISQSRVSQIEGGVRSMSAREEQKFLAALPPEMEGRTGGTQPRFEFSLSDRRLNYLEMREVPLVEAIRYLEFVLDETKRRLALAEVKVSE